MRFQFEEEVGFERVTVLRALCDELPGVVAFVRRVDEVIARKRVETDDVLCVTNDWSAHREQLPAVLRALVTRDPIRWTESTRWERSDFTGCWSIVPDWYEGAVEISGQLELIDEGEDTVLRLSGELQLHLEQITRLPARFREMNPSSVERTMVDAFGPVFQSLAVSLDAFLEASY